MRGKADYSDQYPFLTRYSHDTQETVIINALTQEEVDRFPVENVVAVADRVNELVNEHKAAAA